jgi:hypothetical protein
MKGVILLKLKRPTLFRAAVAAVGITALAGGLAVATVPAHASSARPSDSTFPLPFLLCNHISNRSGPVTVNIFTQNTHFIESAGAGKCVDKKLVGELNGLLQIKIKNKSVDGDKDTEISEIAVVNDAPITDTLAGFVSKIHETITIDG